MTTHTEKQQEFFVTNQMSEPKGTQGVFELPCGYLAPDGSLITEVKVREITGEEEDLLAARNISGGKKLTQLIANCLERLGPVVDKPLLNRLVQDLTVGDRTFLTLAIRRVTLGDEFPFEDTCPACTTKSLFIVDLSGLDVVKMPDPRQRFFDAVLPSGKTARYHVMTGRDEEALAKVDARDRLSAAILVRLDVIDGGPATLETVKALSMRDRQALREEFESHEGGVDTSIELDCPSCGSEFKTELDPGQAGFFFPSRVRKNSKNSTSSF